MKVSVCTKFHGKGEIKKKCLKHLLGGSDNEKEKG